MWTIRHRSGYTLIEVLIVVAMLGLATAMVVPSLSSTDVLRVQSTVRAIVADINYAQSDALARQRGRAIIFDITNNKYSIIEIPSGGGIDPTNNTMYTVNLNNSQKFNNSRITGASFDGTNTLIFDELGGPVADPDGTTPGNGGTITVTGFGTTYTINVEAYTGRVSVTRVGP